MSNLNGVKIDIFRNNRVKPSDKTQNTNKNNIFAMALHNPMNSTSLQNNRDFNRALLAMLLGKTLKREHIVADSLKNRWQDVQNGHDSLTISELSTVLRALEQNRQTINPATAIPAGSPLSQQAFYDSLRQNMNNAESLKEQLRALRESAKKQQGFLRTAFNIFVSDKPLDKVIRDVAAFDKYCRQNGITFDDVNKQLVAGDKPKTTWDKVVDFRFMVAAIGGGILGFGAYASGVNIMETMPSLSHVPQAFFKALPYIALPFIGFSIFRAFAEKSILKEAGTFARFVGTMSLGILIGLGVTSAMAGYLTPLDTSNLIGTLDAGLGADHGSSFSPSQYILHGIGFFAAYASLYKMAKNHATNTKQKATGQLSTLFNKASGVIVNQYTAPAIIKGGNVFKKAGDLTDKGFNHYMNWLGIPAIFLMLAGTVSKGGFDQISDYGGYYATILMGTTICAAALGALAYIHGCRKKEFKEITKTATTAFSISSSAATMPVTKESLKKIGVSESVRNAVVPLGANFNMMGTSLYLGVTAASAMVMFGMQPTTAEMAGVMGLAVLTAFGAPGAPASTIIFLDPVLAKAGMTPDQTAKIYEMIIPIDRPADMAQTSLNVTGDMVVAMNTDQVEKHGWKSLLKLGKG